MTYTGMTSLAVIMLSSALPPLWSSTSSRAVVDVPLTLITAPIAGDVVGVSVRSNGAIASGQTVAAVENTRVDQSTLTGLENEQSAAQVAVDGLRAQQAMYSAYLTSIDQDLDRQRQFLIPQARASEAEAHAQTDAAAQKYLEQQELMSRQRDLLARGVVGSSPLVVAEHLAAAAKSTMEAEQAVLNRRIAQRQALEAGAFVGNDLGPAADLLIRQRDLQLLAAKTTVEIVSTTARLAALHQAIAGESLRLTNLRNARVDAPVDGIVSKVFVNPGRHVLAGETLASVVECRRAVVAAIFSIREAPRLQVGMPVSLMGEGWTGPRSGTIVQVMPRTDSQFDQSYAVPFPPIERREMYVLIEPEWARDANLTPQVGASAPCGTGQWVTASVSGTSGLLDHAVRVARRAMAAAFGPAQNISQQIWRSFADRGPKGLPTLTPG